MKFYETTIQLSQFYSNQSHFKSYLTFLLIFFLSKHYLINLDAVKQDEIIFHEKGDFNQFSFSKIPNQNYDNWSP